MRNASLSPARTALVSPAVGDPDAKTEREARKTILCIEDDQHTAELIAEALEDRGFSVILAKNEGEGWSMLLKSQPDAILSDINTPFMSYFEVLENTTAFAPRFSRVPLIFLTGLNERDDELKGRLLGADDYVTKPIDFDPLHGVFNARINGAARRNAKPAKCDLNDREIEALKLAAHGKTSEEIALIMAIAERTVNFHLNNARDRLSVATPIQAAVKATAAGFIQF